MQQHALGRIDAEPLEQFWVTERQFDHLAQLVDRLRHAADIVVGDVGAARGLWLLVLGAEFDLGILVDVHHALGAGGDHREADLLERVRRRVHELLDVGRHVADALMPRGRDDVALADRPAEEGALKCVGRALEAEVLLRRREHDAGCRFRLGFAHFDEIARTDAGIGTLKAIDAEDIETFVFRIRTDGARGRVLLAEDFDHVAFADAERRHQRARQMRQAAAAVFGTRVGDLDFPRGDFAIGHLDSFELEVSDGEPLPAARGLDRRYGPKTHKKRAGQ
jgi:hypothetical protein